MDIFWNTFERSGSIEAYLGYKEFQRVEKERYLTRDWQSKKNNHLAKKQGAEL